MDKGDLIESITKEVLKRLNNEKNTDNEKIIEKEKLLLTENVKIDLSEELRKRFDICSFGEINTEKSLSEINEIIITKLDMKLLMELSELIQLNPKSEFILTSLLKGKNIYVLTSGVKYYQYQKTSPKTLYNELIKAEDKLKSFGIEFLSLKQLESKLKKDNFSTSEIEKTGEDKNLNEYFRLDKKLIDYSIIKKLHEKNYEKIEVSINSIITALAKDFIKEKNIDLEYIEGR